MPDGVKDVVRDMLVVPTCQAIGELVRAFCECAEIEIVRVKNRFANPSPGGWRDVLLNYVVRQDESRHVCEVQLVHATLLTARKGLPGHAIYNVTRTARELLNRMLGADVCQAQRLKAMSALLLGGPGMEPSALVALLQAGCTPAELRQVGASTVQLKLAGVGLRELIRSADGGRCVSVPELWELGFRADELMEGGVTLEEIIEAVASSLTDGRSGRRRCYALRELVGLKGCSLSVLTSHGVPERMAEAIIGGHSAVGLRARDFSTAELMYMGFEGGVYAQGARVVDSLPILASRNVGSPCLTFLTWARRASPS